MTFPTPQNPNSLVGPIAFGIAEPTTDDMLLEVRATGLTELGEKIDNINRIFRDRTDEALSTLGRILVEEVKRRTPSVSGRLRRSTHYRIERGSTIIRKGEKEFSVSRPEDAQLQIIQDAVARGERAVANRYFYWYTVTHGIKPAGRLENMFPPPKNLTPWIKKRFTTKGGIVDSIKLAHHISKEGTEPNTYIADAYHARVADIQEAAERIGVDITFDLVKLPSVVI